MQLFATTARFATKAPLPPVTLPALEPSAAITAGTCCTDTATRRRTTAAAYELSSSFCRGGWGSFPHRYRHTASAIRCPSGARPAFQQCFVATGRPRECEFLLLLRCPTQAWGHRFAPCLQRQLMCARHFIVFIDPAQFIKSYRAAVYNRLMATSGSARWAKTTIFPSDLLLISAEISCLFDCT